MTQNILKAGGASDSLALSAGDDGTLVLQVGPSGGKVAALSFAADGTPTMLKGPVASMVRLNTANGYGSTNTMIRRFTNTVMNQGSDITYADSAANGASLTINTPGVYSISYTDQFTGAGTSAGLSRNTTQPTTSINSLTNVSEVLAISNQTTANKAINVSWTGYLSATDVIRAHCEGGATGSGPAAQFTITRVA